MADFMSHVTTVRPSEEASKEQTRPSSNTNSLVSEFMELKDKMMSRTVSADWDALSKNILDRSIGEEQ